MAQGTAGRGFLENFQAKVANYTLLPGERVLADHATPATRLTVTLPATIEAGHIVAVATGPNTGGFRIAQNVGQSVKVGAHTTLAGTSGYIDSASSDSVIYLLCTVANTAFEVIAGNALFNVNTASGVVSGVSLIGYPITTAATPSTIPLRDGSGRMKAAAAAASDDVPNLGQLGSNLATLAFGSSIATAAVATGVSEVKISAAPNGVIWAAYAVSGTLKARVSTDGGATWGTERTLESGADMNLVAIDGSTAYLAYYKSGTGSRFAKTTDSGANWTYLTLNTYNGSPTYGPLGISANAAGTVIWATYPHASQSFKAAVSTNSGTSFTESTAGFGSAHNVSIIGFDANNAFLGVVGNGSPTNIFLHKTTTGVNGFSQVYTNVYSLVYNGRNYGFFAAKDTTNVVWVWSGGNAGGGNQFDALYAVSTTNGGTNWTVTNLNPPSQTACASLAGAYWTASDIVIPVQKGTEVVLLGGVTSGFSVFIDRSSIAGASSTGHENACLAYDSGAVAFYLAVRIDSTLYVMKSRYVKVV